MIIILGKSGSGKTSVSKKLTDYGYEMLVTDTTRPKRKYEIDGKDYNFRSRKEFNNLKNSGYYAETVTYHASFGVCDYGSKKDYYTSDNQNKIIILNPYGLKQVNNLKCKNYTSYYLKISDDLILDRLNKRGDSKEEIYRRLKTDEKDFENIEKIVDHTIVINQQDSIDDIANKIMNIQKRL